MGRYFLLFSFIWVFLLGAIPLSVNDLQKESYDECIEGKPCRYISQVPLKEAISTESQASCTSTSSVFMAANDNRVEAEYINIGTTDVYVCRGTATCTTSIGRPYTQYSGRIDDTYQGLYSCITATGTATLYKSEITR